MLHAPTRNARRRAGERGASAVEFALVLPLLLVFLFGVISVSRAFQVQATIAGAAREAARSFAIDSSASTARTKAVNAASGSSVTLTDSNISISPSSCKSQPAGTDVTVTITYTFQPFGVYANGAAFPITAKSVFRCGA